MKHLFKHQNGDTSVGVGSRTRSFAMALIIAGCVAKPQGGTSGGNTSWLGYCGADSECATGLCLQDACAKRCSAADDCSELSSSAICAPVSSGSACDLAEANLCAPACQNDDDCADIGTGYGCSGGACVAECEPEANEVTADDDCSLLECGGECIDGDMVRADGESWGACNEFSCLAGEIFNDPIECQRCEYDGETYDDGARFGLCGECSCSAGEVNCLDQCPDCEVDGVTVPYEQEYPASDTCNTCTCGGGCTQIGCGAADRCVYDGELFRSGSSFGPCEACSCEDGEVACDDALVESCGSSTASMQAIDAGIADARAPVVEYGQQLDGGQCVLIDGVGVLDLTLARGYIPLPADIADFERTLECYPGVRGSTTLLRAVTDCEQIRFETYGGDEPAPARRIAYTFDAASGELLRATDERATEWGPCSGVSRYEIGEALPGCAILPDPAYCEPLELRDGG